jgi:hypothetical protein
MNVSSSYGTSLYLVMSVAGLGTKLTVVATAGSNLPVRPSVRPGCGTV